MLAYLFVWPWWVTIALAIAVVVILSLAYDREWDDGPVIFAFVLVLTAVMFAIFALTVSIGRHYERINCRRFEATTGRPTRYVIYSIASTACLTRSGKTWLPITQVREFGNG